MNNDNTVPAAIKTARRTTTRRSTAIIEARIGVVRNWLEDQGQMFLDRETYCKFREDGFSSRDLDRCVELMAERGQVTVETCDAGVMVDLVEDTENEDEPARRTE
jgi:hypothetical protein